MNRLRSEFSVDKCDHEIEVWPNAGQQIPALPLMAVDQKISFCTGATYVISGVEVMESCASDEDPFDCVYAWKYDVIKVSG
jgi:hypothetical protein